MFADKWQATCVMAYDQCSESGGDRSDE